MEGLPMLTCLIQHTLKTLCTCSSSEDNSSNKWVYSVFWRILPRIYPPPKWDVDGGVLDRAKGNKRNWILVWEDGYCDIDECERVANGGSSNGGFGADIFFKLSHEVYNYGEGLIGKIASDNSHKWVFEDGLNEHDPSFISSWNASVDPQPKAWEFHFNSGIKTIAIISTREGIIQLGSFDKVLEDMNLVLNIQRKFNYLRTIPGLFSIQRPLSTTQHPCNLLKHKSIIGGENQPYKGPIWSFGPGYISQESVRVGSHGPPFWPIPPLLPCNYGSHVSGNANQSLRDNVEDPDLEPEKKPICFSPNPEFVMELGFGPKKKMM
ncbi:protein RICE SALT SENSITIVE 3-like [Bidens hawaiensis]|uniref:protein RICE SALT SENSITIVE 3-like n=1 Tax=Bidens hawaiensis TaxID=980011 RepID=UPI004049F16A